MPSRDIKDCTPLLQEFWGKFYNWYLCRNTGLELFLTCTYRSPEEQLEIFQKNSPGHILTRCDGYKILSNHNHKPALAFDVALRAKDGTVIWDDFYYVPLGLCLKELGYDNTIRWGGNFSFRDYPHWEMR